MVSNYVAHTREILFAGWRMEFWFQLLGKSARKDLNNESKRSIYKSIAASFFDVLFNWFDVVAGVRE